MIGTVVIAIIEIPVLLLLLIAAFKKPRNLRVSALFACSIVLLLTLSIVGTALFGEVLQFGFFK